MSMCNPCPCMSLQRGTTILAVIDAVISGIGVALAVLLLVGVGAYKTDDKDGKSAAIVAVILLLVIGILQLILALYLRKSARQYNYHGCKRWLTITAVLLIISIVTLIVDLVSTSGLDTTSLIIDIIDKLYRIYVMFVVYSLMKEIDMNNGTPPHTYINGGV